MGSSFTYTITTITTITKDSKFYNTCSASFTVITHAINSGSMGWAVLVLRTEGITCCCNMSIKHLA